MAEVTDGPQVTDGAQVPDDVWDVIVVGAGPAGASAAHAAAAAGRRVLLLEKAELPRYKTCGGGIIGPSRTRCRRASCCRWRTASTRSPSPSTAD